MDFQLPIRFDLRFKNSNGENERAVMVHRALLGSVERFLGMLLENTEGKLPKWLTPRQVQVCSVTDDSKEYAERVSRYLVECGVRSEDDGEKGGTLNAKIRRAASERVGLICVVGKEEVDEGTVDVREGKERVGKMKVEELAHKVLSYHPHYRYTLDSLPKFTH